MPGAAPKDVQTYRSNVAIAQAFLGVVIDTAEGTCKLPTAAGDLVKMLGVAQATADAAAAVAVAKQGTTYLKANGTIARGARVTLDVTAGNEGKGIALTEPTAPAAITGGEDPTEAEHNALIAYVAALQDADRKTIGYAAEAAADDDLFLVKLGKDAVV